MQNKPVSPSNTVQINTQLKGQVPKPSFNSANKLTQQEQKNVQTIAKNVHIRVPKGWNHEAQYYWLESQPQKAIQTVLSDLNQYADSIRPAERMLQLSYYLYLNGDRAAAAQFLELAHEQHPQDIEILKNLAVTLSANKQDVKALAYWEKYQQANPEDYLMYDAMSMCYYRLNQLDQAHKAGSKALTLKDIQHGILKTDWRLPSVSISEFLKAKPKKVIAFSLWGKNPRYLRGAIDNAQARFYIYPDWIMRFYVDDSVPTEICEALKKLNCEVIQEPPQQTSKQKLAWRFKVAHDSSIGRFLVRDVDSVVNAREKAVVEEWMRSEKWFHVMRDWWSHTDLILAGMWGGIADVLPNLSELLENYTPLAMETPNVDQWFLRDCIWAYVKQSCLVHDRCFITDNTTVWHADQLQKYTNWHVGQDIHAVEPEEQLQRLRPWLAELKSLN